MAGDGSRSVVFIHRLLRCVLLDPYKGTDQWTVPQIKGNEEERRMMLIIIIVVGN